MCSGVCAAIMGALFFCALIHLGLLRAMPSEGAIVFLRALVLSTLLSIPPVAELWYLDRSERKTPVGSSPPRFSRVALSRRRPRSP